jgi:hypothetical protein
MKPAIRPDHDPMPHPIRAIVIFRGELEFPWFYLLKPRFRHCFVLWRIADGWIVLDPLCGRLMIKPLPAYSVAELIRFYAAKRAIPVPVMGPVMAPMIRSLRRKRSCLALLQPMTCVAVVKNILNLRGGFIWTPWQLFLSLTKPPTAGPPILPP